jgi:hypothetical protein
MTTTWFTRNAELLAQLFQILELEAPVHDAEALASWCETEGWYGEHGRQSGRPTFPDEAVTRAKPVLRRIGLDGQVDPPAAAYNEIVVMGAAGIGLHRRIGLIAESPVESPTLTVLAGLRPHEGSSLQPGGRVNDGRLGELVARDGRFAARPGWDPHPAHLHLQRVLTGVDDHTAASIVFPSETDLAALLLSKHFPDATVLSTEHSPPHDVVNELGQRSWARRTWKNPKGSRINSLVVQNSYPVERRNLTTGERIPSRPTATSTFREWLDHHDANRSLPSNILLVVNQPHLGRIYQQVTDVLGERARSGLAVDVAGCATLQDVDINLLLGEIPRWIRADAAMADRR